ncbi:MAG: L-serine ammonia-lyase, iron-sulfur-dependent subunit beta [Oscillospiraceae bacterium]
MNISILDVLGPVMVGPSSSHTAGAARLGRVAAIIAKKPFNAVCFYLHGSFAKTGVGHGTPMALLAGVLGIYEDDENMNSAYELADSKNISYKFAQADLGDVHENSCKIVFSHLDGSVSTISGSSVGGGRIVITAIDGTETNIFAEQPTIIIRQNDRKGVIASIAAVLAENDINIAVMRLWREQKGDIATTVIETDDELPDSLENSLMKCENVIDARVINAYRRP